jgi:hypothetical protein
MVLEIFKNLAIFQGFSLLVPKIFGISALCEQILKRPTQGTFLFLQEISSLGIIVSEKRILIGVDIF